MEPSYLSNLYDRYEGSEKVNKIRFEILDQILKGEGITLDRVNELKEEINRNYEKNILNSWTNYTILFPLYYEKSREVIQEKLYEIHQYVRTSEAFNDLNFEEDKVINDFMWRQNFGGTDVWVALFPKEINSHQESAQLFLRIDPEKVSYGLKLGEKISDLLEVSKYEDLENIDRIENFTFERLKNKFQDVLKDFKKINFEIVPKHISQERDNLKFEGDRSEISSGKAIENVNYWLIAPGRQARLWEDMYQNGIIALGWDEIGDYRDYENKEEIAEAIKKERSLDRTPKIKAGNCYDFLHKVEVGDYVIVKEGRGKILGYGEVTSDYRYDPSRSEYHHVRDVDWKSKNECEVDKSLPIKTVTEISQEEGKEYIDIIDSSGPGQRDNVKLASPFDQYFTSIENANTYLDFMESFCRKIGIDSQTNPNFVSNDRNDEWLVLTIANKWLLGMLPYENDDSLRLALPRKFAETENFESTGEFQWDGWGEISLYKVPRQKFEDKISTFSLSDDPLKFVVEKYSQLVEDFTASPFKEYHDKRIGEMVFNKEIRNKRLGEGLKEQTSKNPGRSLVEENLANDFSLDLTESELHFPEPMVENLENQIHSALSSEKHIVLVGPPGTGKSKLAKIICEQYRGNKDSDYQMTTATSDWTTFDTIGGLMPDQQSGGENLIFNPGIFLDCFEYNGQPANRWLIIDEINRADIDKAFGALFSVLTGDPITLSFEADNGRRIKIRSQAEERSVDEEYREIAGRDHLYVVPEDWRLIATMNTFDKSSLYEMSYAFMRRFAFIPVGVPDVENLTVDDFETYAEIWGLEDAEHLDRLREFWKTINQFRSIGPAIAEDLLQHVESGGDWASALIMYVFPQFEGLIRDKQIAFIQELHEGDNKLIEDESEWKQLVSHASDFFGIDMEKIAGEDSDTE